MKNKMFTSSQWRLSEVLSTCDNRYEGNSHFNSVRGTVIIIKHPYSIHPDSSVDHGELSSFLDTGLPQPTLLLVVVFHWVLVKFLQIPKSLTTRLWKSKLPPGRLPPSHVHVLLHSPCGGKMWPLVSSWDLYVLGTSPFFFTGRIGSGRMLAHPSWRLRTGWRQTKKTHICHLSWWV